MKERACPRIMDKLVVTRSSFDSLHKFSCDPRARTVADSRIRAPLFLFFSPSANLPSPAPSPYSRLARAQGERQREREQPFARFPNSMGTRKRVFERFAWVGRGGGGGESCWSGGWQGGRRGREREISFTVQPV